MDQRDLDIDASVTQYGWTAIGVEEYGSPYVYSVGLLYSANHPEIVIAGLPEDGYALLQLLVKLIAEGRSFTLPGIYDDILDGVPFAIRAIHQSHHDDYLGHALCHYCRKRDDSELAAVQLFWPDNAGRFPFDLDCDPDVADRQPRLDEPADSFSEQEVA